MTTKKPTAEDFDQARAAVPAQHPSAGALLAAITDAQIGNGVGLIDDEYAHEVIRWARRSGAHMALEMQTLHTAMHAIECHARAKAQIRRDTMAACIIGGLMALALLLLAATR